MTLHLSLTIGPVQGFVAQARRTRDLWAGSWLLSYLSECALVAAENAGGKAIIPHRSEPTILTSKRSAIGGIPNRIELRFTGSDAESTAKEAAIKAEKGFVNAWQKVARAVFDKFVQPVINSNNETEVIWQRQVESFWERSWVVGSPEGETVGNLAAWRKNFRNVAADLEPGTKCSLMPSLQEISGHYGRGQKKFWQQLRNHVGSFDLGDSERLCAIALIKRLFPRVIKQAIGDDISEDLNQIGWPSTAFMAALPWLKSLKGETLTVANDYQKSALDSGYQKSERDAARRAGVDWADADGPIWFSSAIRNDEPASEKLGQNPGMEDKAKRVAVVRDLSDKLKHVYRTAAREQPSGEESAPVPYYALLLMDGDSIGKLLKQLNTQSLSECLGVFASQVNRIVEQNNGRTVYAGGDDVMALLPADKSLKAADELCDVYRQSFSDTDAKGIATISASIVYAHWRYPLRQVIRTAHDLLDNVAKDRTGRDSIALGVMLGSGLSAVWSVPWLVLRGEAKTENNDPCVSLAEILEKFSDDDLDSGENDNPHFNASFLYLLRERFNRLFHQAIEEPGAFGQLHSEGDLPPELLRDVAHAEYRRRMKNEKRLKVSQEQTQPIIDQLMSLSRCWQRKANNGNNGPIPITCDLWTFSFDGWRVARFLKQLQDGKVSDHD